MTQITPSFISLLPPLYRNDNGAGESNELGSFTELLDASRSKIESNIEALYASWFVETCPPARLASRASLTGLQTIPASAYASRKLVADHAWLNAAKGTGEATSKTLEALGGWPCSSVLDPSRVRAEITVDQTRIQTIKGASPRFALTTAYGTSFWFNSLGLDTPLYRASGKGGSIDRSANPSQIAANIQVFQRSKKGEKWRSTPVETQDLSAWEGEGLWSKTALVDPQLGRLWLPGEGIQSKNVMVSFSVAAVFPQGHPPRLELPPLSDGWHAHIHREVDAGFRNGVHYFNDLADAFQAAQSVSQDLHFMLLDGASHSIGEVKFSDRSKSCPSDPNSARRITISARQGEWPTLIGDIFCISKGRRVIVELNGVCLDGLLGLFGNVEATLTRTVLYAATYWKFETDPLPAVIVDGSASGRNARLKASHSVVGTALCSEAADVVLTDSILVGPPKVGAVVGKGDITANRTTVFGLTQGRSIVAQACAFMGALDFSDKVETGRSWKGGETDTSFFVSTSISEPGFGVPNRSIFGNPLLKYPRSGELGSTRLDRVGLREALIREALGSSNQGHENSSSELLPLGLAVHLSFVQENGASHGQ